MCYWCTLKGVVYVNDHYGSWVTPFQVVIPEEKDMQGTAVKPSLSKAIGVTVDCLKDSLSWVHKEPSLKQKFCLDFLNACFQQIPVSESSTDWAEKYRTVLWKLGEVFDAARKQCKDVATLFELPSEVSFPSPRQYFHLMERIHKILMTWKSMIEDKAANYDFILEYKNHYRHISNLATAVSATGLIVSSQKAMDAQLMFLQQFERMNQLLIKYIQDDPKAGW